MRVPRKERAKFMIWQVLTESCLHKGHGSCRERFTKVLDMMFREEGISR